jgi:hypothetical protein
MKSFFSRILRIVSKNSKIFERTKKHAQTSRSVFTRLIVFGSVQTVYRHPLSANCAAEGGQSGQRAAQQDAVGCDAQGLGCAARWRCAHVGEQTAHAVVGAHGAEDGEEEIPQDQHRFDLCQRGEVSAG